MPSHFRRELIISFSIIAAAFVVFGLGSYLLLGDVEAEASKIVADRSLISKRADAIASLADLKKNSAQADVYRQAMAKILVTQDQLLDFPRWIDGLSRAHNVNAGFSFRGNQTAPQGMAPGKIAFGLETAGGLDDVIGFLRDVELQGQGFLVTLDDFDLTSSGSGYRVQTSGNVYFQ